MDTREDKGEFYPGGGRSGGDAPTPPAPAIVVDEGVTKDSANPVKSSGIWGAIWGALTALPTGVASLYDWCVAQLARKQAALSAQQLAAANSGVTAAKVATWVGYAAQIAAKANAADLRYRIAEAVRTAKLPSSAFPIEYTDETATPTSRTITSADDVILAYSEQAPNSIIAYDKNNPDYAGTGGFGFASFNATTGEFVSKDTPIASLSFNGSATTTLDLVYLVADRAVNLVTATDETSIDIELPAAVTVDDVRYCRDFFFDIDNSANANDLTLEFTALGVDYGFVPLEDDSVGEMVSIGAGERVRLYFAETPYHATGSLPVINVARVTVGDFVTSTTGGNS